MENVKEFESKIKSRKFIYEIERFDENNKNKIESLKNEVCKYHIIGYNNDSYEKYTKISGFICFQNPRFLKSVIKLLGLQNVQYTDEDSYVIHERISEMNTFWEKGELPKQCHDKTIPKKSNKKTNPMAFIMNQSQQLLEHTFEQNQKLIDQNKELLEQNKQLSIQNLTNNKYKE